MALTYTGNKLLILAINYLYRETGQYRVGTNRISDYEENNFSILVAAVLAPNGTG